MKILKILFLISLISLAGCGIRKPVATINPKNIEEKYSKILGVTRENISDKKLYSFIENWYGVPYQYGGKTKKGVDCSGFTSVLLKEVYEKEINGSSLSIYNQCKHIPANELKEGDLVFFIIDSKDVSHVGVYLQNNKFVHATTKGGVMINDLNEEYYRKYFTGGGKSK